MSFAKTIKECVHL